MDLYKRFHPSRTVFYAVFLSFFLLPALAQANAIFTVNDVEVDVTAKSALAAREQAFTEAQVKAFDILAERMLPADEKESFKAPDAATISTMIMDFEVTKEKLSNVRYIGTYKFRFKESAVKKLFASAGVSYTDVASKQLLILPFYESQGELSLWSPYNIWMQAWNRLEGQNAVVPVVVPMGDLSDVRDIGDDEALSYSPSKLKDLQARYDAAETVLAIARPDTDFSMLDKGSDKANGNLQIEIYRTDQKNPQLVQKSVVTFKDGESRDSMMDRAVAEVQKILRQDWKSKTAVSSFGNNNMIVRVPLDSFHQWAETERVLKQVSVVNGVTLKSLSPKQAIVELLYQGDEARLKTALQQNQIVLAPAAVSGAWLYDLYTSSNAPEGSAASVQPEAPMNNYEPATGGFVAEPQTEPPPQIPDEAPSQTQAPSVEPGGYLQRF